MQKKLPEHSIDISIIVPLFNEQDFVEALITSLLKPDGLNKELLLVDGGSTDRTLEVIERITESNPVVKLVKNAERFVSHGFNKAFGLASGQYIALIGAHAIYSDGYFSSGVQALQNGSCDAVGGCLVQKGKNDFGRAIAYVMSTKLGVGGTEFRTESRKMYVDSVAFAIYRREVFQKVGLLDEQLVRNQDDEFHYRMNRAGFKILMIPEMKAEYFVRDSLLSLYKQYFGYGLYKPLVLKKVPNGVRPRHLVPAFFAIYICSLPIVYFFPPYVVPLVLYLMLIVFFSFKSRLFLRVKLISMSVYPVLHMAYGLGFIKGLKLLFKYSK